MTDLTNVSSGIAPVSPDEEAADGLSNENVSDAAQGRKQTRASAEVKDVDRGAIGEQARDPLGGSLRAQENLSRLADEKKNASAERISDLARAVHEVANNLERDLPQAVKPLHDAAAALERAANTLKERSVVALMDGVGRFARAQPVAFFGGTVLAGLVLARFLKSSNDQSSRS
jgi:hypothetical protein